MLNSMVMIAFLAGAAVAGLPALWTWYRHLETRSNDPLVNPVGPEEKTLVDLLRHQLLEARLLPPEHVPSTGRGGVAELRRLRRCASSDAVWLTGQGQLHPPGGDPIDLRKISTEVEQGLLCAYRALDEAASVVQDLADHLPVGALEAEGQLLYASRYAFQREILLLARLLEIDPERNSVARHGGAALWRRQMARTFAGAGAFRIYFGDSQSAALESSGGRSDRARSQRGPETCKVDLVL